jgi:L-seryl-tRNA(Ser) seleniumtransferase
VQTVVAEGADVVTFSGDKLLGGPQAGILVGKKRFLSPLGKHPLMRALRPDKLTLAALHATLSLYRDGKLDRVPAVRMIAQPPEILRKRAEALAARLGGTVESCTSTVGGGAMPTAELPSFAVTMSDPEALDRKLRGAAVPVIARIEDGRLWLDVRTIADDEVEDVVRAAIREDI